MADYANLPFRNASGNFHVVVEAPKGSKIKLKYEPDLGAFVFQRALVLGTVYPHDWGFVPSTRAHDGDPLDALVLFDTPTWPGVVIECKAVGVVRLSQREEGETKRNDRIIAVPAMTFDQSTVRDVEDLPKRMRHELEQFFVNASKLASKHVHVEGWENAEAAERAVEQAAASYASHRLSRNG